MKKIVYLFFIIAIISACSSDDETNKSIEVDKEQLNQTVYADETQSKSGVSFTTTAAWTSSITETTTKSLKDNSTPENWVSVTPDRGDKAGNYTITINLTPNYTGAERSATITISCNGETIEIKITQEATDKDGVKPVEKEVDVYVAGLTDVSGKSTAMYWKNGEAVILGQYNSSANDIVVTGGNVYVVGDEINEGIYDAVYWVNDKKMVLGNGTYNSHADAIHVLGTDIYIVGYEERYSETGGWYDVPKCWKNGIEMPLSLNFTHNDAWPRPHSCRAVDITSSGNDVYVACDINVGDSLAYWKNAEAQFVPTKYNSIYIDGIAVNGSDVYLAGTATNIKLYDIATYWKNKTEVRVVTEVGYSGLDDIFIAGNDVYLVGSDGKNACYWKNKEKIIFDKKDITSFSSIYVLDNNIYLCGDYESDNEPVMTGKYWINKEMYSLGKYSTANSIFVVKR